MTLHYNIYKTLLFSFTSFYNYSKGLSKLFGESADEERQHGIKFISYLRMRGGDTTSDFFENGKLEPILDKYILSLIHISEPTRPY